MRELILLLTALVAASGCATQQVVSNESSGTVVGSEASLPETSRVKLAVYEYLIRKALRQCPEVVLTVRANDLELKVLSSKFPGVSLRAEAPRNTPRDYRTGGNKPDSTELLITVSGIRISDGRAKAIGRYRTRGIVEYSLQLVKDSDWAVLSCEKTMVAD